MQKLDRLSKVGIVAIVVLVVFGGAGMWWWSQQPLDTAKADPPPTPTADVSATKAPESQAPKQSPTEGALAAYVEFENAYIEMAKEQGAETATQRVLALVTEDGDMADQVRSGQSSYQSNPLRVTSGQYRMAKSSTLSTGQTEVRLDVCWDSADLHVEGDPLPRFRSSQPTMRRHDGRWLVHALDANVVESCE